jgi:hypothetical protein
MMDLKEKFRAFSGIKLRSGLIFGMIIFTALFAFEVFNYSTTDFALQDLLGELRFANVRWATILAIAFCGIDFAGIARLFTPQQGSNEPKEVWYLFGAWLLAATMNAMLTWWGVSMAIANHTIQSSTFMEAGTLLRIVPIFVALMVWVIRILIIGTISTAADHLIWGDRRPGQTVRHRPSTNPISRPLASTNGSRAVSRSTAVQGNRPSYNRPLINNSANSQVSAPSSPASAISTRPEPTYHSMRSHSNNQPGRQL